MNKTITVEINLRQLFICYMSLIFLALIFNYVFYSDLGITYSILAIFPVVFVQLLFRQKVYIENQKLILEETNWFDVKKDTFFMSDISDIKSYIFGLSIRVKERTILLDYCKYKKSEINNLIEYIVTKQNQFD